MKIVYFHPWGIGDFMFISGILDELSKSNHDVLLLTNNTQVDELICRIYPYNTVCLKKGFIRGIWSSIKFRPDFFIPSYGVSPLKLFLLLLLVFKFPSKLLPYVRLRRKLTNSGLHRAYANLALIRLFFDKLSPPSLYRISKSNLSTSQQIYKVIFHLGSGGNQAYKRWDAGNWKKVIREISRETTVAVLVGPDEKSLADIFSDCDVDCFVEPSLIEASDIISSARIFVSVDMGFAHLASALNVRTITLFGPSNPSVFRPLGEGIVVTSGEELDCQPCIRPGGLYGCEAQDCMKNIKVETVLSLIKREMDQLDI
jgi:hypothetical protein